MKKRDDKTGSRLGMQEAANSCHASSCMISGFVPTPIVQSPVPASCSRDDLFKPSSTVGLATNVTFDAFESLMGIVVHGLVLN